MRAAYQVVRLRAAPNITIAALHGFTMTKDHKPHVGAPASRPPEGTRLRAGSPKLFADLGNIQR
jgi:hypothetical protein